jgi:hypothetical protein
MVLMMESGHQRILVAAVRRGKESDISDESACKLVVQFKIVKPLVRSKMKNTHVKSNTAFQLEINCLVNRIFLLHK